MKVGQFFSNLSLSLVFLEIFRKTETYLMSLIKSILDYSKPIPKKP